MERLAVGAGSCSAAYTDASSIPYMAHLAPCLQQLALDDTSAAVSTVESSNMMMIKDMQCTHSRRVSLEAALQELKMNSKGSDELPVNSAPPPQRENSGSAQYHIFVGDLASDVTDTVLHDAFACIGACSDARVMWDHSTGRSKGYGFIAFQKLEEAEAAMSTMQGALVGSRRIRLGWAQHKPEENETNMDFDKTDKADPTNTNVYVGNLAQETTKADLTSFFSAYGPVVEVKLHKKGGYGFIKYAVHKSAVCAIVAENKELHGRALRCSWGKNTHPASSNGVAAVSGKGPGSRGSVSAPPRTISPFPAVVPLPARPASFPVAPRQQQLVGGYNDSQATLLLNALLGMNHGGGFGLAAPQAAGFGSLAAPQAPGFAPAPPQGRMDMMGNTSLFDQPELSQMGPSAMDSHLMLLQGLQSQDNMRRQAAMAALGPDTATALQQLYMSSGNIACDPAAMYPADVYSNMYRLDAIGAVQNGAGYAGYAPDVPHTQQGARYWSS